MTVAVNFHRGEVQIQAEDGVDTAALDAGVAEAFPPALNTNEARFVEQRTFSIAGTIDADGRPWGSPLFGASGELFSVVDDTTVRVTPQVIDGDPLIENIEATGELGILYFQPSRRRRAKSLGRGTLESDGAITYQMRRNYGLCTKYIFKRDHDGEFDQTGSGRPQPTTSRHLGHDDQTQLEASDTVFVVSHHDEHGTDPTHRGGPKGFVTVVDDTTVSLPDYPGNGMFQTLGNLLLDDRIGLTSIDFHTGRTVQLTGHGSIVASDPDDIYSKRTLHIDITEVRTTWPDVGGWTDVEAFELRPGQFNPATPYLSDDR